MFVLLCRGAQACSYVLDRTGILLMSNWIVAIYTVGDAFGRMILQWCALRVISFRLVRGRSTDFALYIVRFLQVVLSDQTRSLDVDTGSVHDHMVCAFVSVWAQLLRKRCVRFLVTCLLNTTRV